MNNELLEVATQALEYLKESGIKKPHFIKKAERVIKEAKQANKPLSKAKQKSQQISKHFDAYLAGGQDISYTKIHVALKQALKANPDGMADSVEVLHEGEMVTIDLIEDLEYTTVQRFCEMCGIEL